MRCSAFTLIEVLFAVVLLALVVGVCVPYMRSGPHDSSSAVLAEFTANIDEEFVRLRLSHASGPTLEEISEIMGLVGNTCIPVGRPDKELQGQWVLITDGVNTVFRWARIDVKNKADGS